jgi:hypothetical protein
MAICEVTSAPDFLCGNGHGPMEFVACPGRLRRYRGEDGYEVPADLVIPTCPVCGDTWENHAIAMRLTEAFEAQRQNRRAKESP